MFARKAIALVGLVLAVAVVSPTTAMAKAGGTERPIAISGSGTSAWSQADGTLSAEAAGIGWQLGQWTSTFNGTLTFTSPTTFTFSGSITYVVANGDELYGTLAGTTTIGTPADVVLTISGGSGRFDGATGALTGTLTSVFVSFGPPVINTTEISLRGTVSY